MNGINNDYNIGNSTNYVNSIMKKIDSYVLENSIYPDIIKIDVEGYEYQVIIGAYNTIKEHSPVIFMELHGEWIKNNGYSHIDIYNLLSNIGYKFYNLDMSPIINIDEELSIFAKRVIAKK
jgi:hypothetical protein